MEIGSDSTSVGGVTNLANGQITVSGAGALLNANNNGIEIAREGTGNLTVSQGGSVTAGSPSSVDYEALEIGRVGTGSMVLTDPGSSVTVNGLAEVGRAGTASIQIENHATMTAANDPSGINGSGEFEVGLGNGANGSTQTRVWAGGSGTAQIASGADLFAVRGVYVGGEGANGALSISTGGTVESGNLIGIGLSETIAASGTLITASGTTAPSAATLLTGNGIITVGAGALLKADGSDITTSGTSDIQVGEAIGSTAELNVTGAGATVNSNGKRIGVAGAGQGSLLVAQGGTVLAVRRLRPMPQSTRAAARARRVR